MDLSFASENNIIRWDPLNGSYWATFLRVAYRRVGGLRQVGKGGSCASSSSFILSTLYRSYIDPLSTLHGANISPTLTPHGPYIARPLTHVILTYSKIDIAIFNENSKQTKTNEMFWHSWEDRVKQKLPRLWDQDSSKPSSLKRAALLITEMIFTIRKSRCNFFMHGVRNPLDTPGLAALSIIGHAQCAWH